MRRRVGLASLGLAAVLLATGCGTGGVSHATGDASAGKQLFVKNCASCHTLKDAAALGTIGPNLDNAFGAVRSDQPGQGFKESTIREVVLTQIKYPNVPNAGSTDPVMPANLVRGQDAVNVASYVASIAGKPGQGGGGSLASAGTNGKAIFTTAGCSNCHTLKAAGSSGTIGPNLDDAKPSKARAVQRVTNGKGQMPSFKGQLKPNQIQAVAEYVSSNAGK